MLELLYNTTDNSIIAWCADENQFGNFKPKPNEAVVILPIDPPDYDSDQFFVDLKKQIIYGKPTLPIPTRNLAIEIDELKAEIDKLKKR